MRLSQLVGAALGTGLLSSPPPAGLSLRSQPRPRIIGAMRSGATTIGTRSAMCTSGPSSSVERPCPVVRERPVFVERERPVFVQPAPMYAAPMQMPAYQNQGPSGLNLNFNISSANRQKNPSQGGERGESRLARLAEGPRPESCRPCARPRRYCTSPPRDRRQPARARPPFHQ